MKLTKSLFTLFLAALMTVMMATPRPARAQHSLSFSHIVTMSVLTGAAINWGYRLPDIPGRVAKVWNKHFGILVLAYIICLGSSAISATPTSEQWDEIRRNIGDESLKDIGEPALRAAFERAQFGESPEAIAIYLKQSLE